MMWKTAAAAFGAWLVIASTPAYSLPCPGAANEQVCCSARRCGGKILSNRDRHNCTNKGGKSWHAAGGRCVNL